MAFEAEFGQEPFETKALDKDSDQAKQGEDDTDVGGVESQDIDGEGLEADNHGVLGGEGNQGDKEDGADDGRGEGLFESADGKQVTTRFSFAAGIGFFKEEDAEDGADKGEARGEIERNGEAKVAK